MLMNIIKLMKNNKNWGSTNNKCLKHDTLSLIHTKISKKIFSHLTKRKNQPHYVTIYIFDMWTSNFLTHDTRVNLFYINTQDITL